MKLSELRQLKNALLELYIFANNSTCTHSESFKGVAYEVCFSCGEKWPTNKGGKPEIEKPNALVSAENMLDLLDSEIEAAVEREAIGELLNAHEESKYGIFNDVFLLSLETRFENLR